MEIINEKDPNLWRTAQKRAAFKQGLFSYFAVNGFLWLIWFYTDNNYFSGIPWPVWPMLGWGLGLAFEFHEAYYGNKKDMAEREYEKMKNERK